jgi:hypothetical protein
MRHTHAARMDDKENKANNHPTSQTKENELLML